MNLTHDMLERLEQLAAKYEAMGQDMLSYLDGLLYADYLTYWDYIHLDTLLSLQTPKTRFPDEEIFIIYHQITELYFKLTLNALSQIVDNESLSLELFKRQLRRVNQYYDVLVDSFESMVSGMDKEEFLKFRMSLLPASGFQSGQCRKIEITSTDFTNLVHPSQRGGLKGEESKSAIYDVLYWKRGATELATGKKTLTLKQFEKKYSKEFIELAEDMDKRNVYQRYKQLSLEEQQDVELINLMKQFDFNVNVRWALGHYRAAVRHLNREPNKIEATGGTNWQQYLPPKNQRIIFYPELWKEDELENWGKTGER